MQGEIEALFGDGPHKFRLTIGGAEELEERCKAGVPVILRAVARDEATSTMLRETLRLGPVGAGMAPEKALLLMARYAETGVGRLRDVAFTILAAFWLGVEDDPPPKSEPGPDASPDPGATA